MAGDRDLVRTCDVIAIARRIASGEITHAEAEQLIRELAEPAEAVE